MWTRSLSSAREIRAVLASAVSADITLWEGCEPCLERPITIECFPRHKLGGVAQDANGRLTSSKTCSRVGDTSDDVAISTRS